MLLYKLMSYHMHTDRFVTSLMTGALPTAVANSNAPTVTVAVTAKPESNYKLKPTIKI